MSTVNKDAIKMSEYAHYICEVWVTLYLKGFLLLMMSIY